MKDDIKVAVVHPGKQHSFQTAKAVNYGNFKLYYLTTVYLKKGNYTSFVYNFFKLLNKLGLIDSSFIKRIEGRRSPNILDSDIYQFSEILGLLQLFLLRMDKKRHILRIFDDFFNYVFSKKVSNFIINNDIHMLVMFNSLLYTHKILEKKAPHIIRIVDSPSASKRYMKKIFEQDAINFPEYAKSYESFFKYWNEENLKRMEESVKASHFIICPSTYVKKTLEFIGVPGEKIYVCPYGVDTFKFRYIKKIDKKTKEPLKLIYVGRITQEKGLGYLFKALEIFSEKQVELTLVGQDFSNGGFNKYLKKYNYYGFVTQDKLLKILKDNDVMIFPSLSDAFALSVMEGMSVGLPVICTENTGISDLIENGKNGFIVKTASVDDLKEKIEWFIKNSHLISEMGYYARKTAEKYTWERYYSSYSNILWNIYEKNLNR